MAVTSDCCLDALLGNLRVSHFLYWCALLRIPSELIPEGCTRQSIVRTPSPVITTELTFAGQ